MTAHKTRNRTIWILLTIWFALLSAIAAESQASAHGYKVQVRRSQKTMHSRSSSFQIQVEDVLTNGEEFRSQILRSLGKLIYDRYDELNLDQLEILYRIYENTLKRKYNIFEAASKLRSLRGGPLGVNNICKVVNGDVCSCINNSSQVCDSLQSLESRRSGAENGLSSIAESVEKYFPGGLSLQAMWKLIRKGDIRVTPKLLAGLIQHIQFDSFDNEVRRMEKIVSDHLMMLGDDDFVIDSMAISSAYSIPDLLKIVLKSNSKLFPAKEKKAALLLSEHVERNLDSISENIEHFGVIYEKHNINMKYLFEIAIPDDLVDTDIVIARNNLVRAMDNNNAQDSMILEKYQFTNPAQLSLEILRQMKHMSNSISVSKNVIRALRMHADFWRKDYTIDDVADFLKLFDAYDNLVENPKFNEFFALIESIKAKLSHSKSVDLELTCTMPRPCLRRVLLKVMECSMIDQDTKSDVSKFLQLINAKGTPIINEPSEEFLNDLPPSFDLPEKHTEEEQPLTTPTPDLDKKKTTGAYAMTNSPKRHHKDPTTDPLPPLSTATPKRGKVTPHWPDIQIPRHPHQKKKHKPTKAPIDIETVTARGKKHPTKKPDRNIPAKQKNEPKLHFPETGAFNTPTIDKPLPKPRKIQTPKPTLSREDGREVIDVTTTEEAHDRNMSEEIDINETHERVDSSTISTAGSHHLTEESVTTGSKESTDILPSSADTTVTTESAGSTESLTESRQDITTLAPEINTATEKLKPRRPDQFTEEKITNAPRKPLQTRNTPLIEETTKPITSSEECSDSSDCGSEKCKDSSSCSEESKSSASCSNSSSESSSECESENSDKDKSCEGPNCSSSSTSSQSSEECESSSEEKCSAEVTEGSSSISSPPTSSHSPPTNTRDSSESCEGSSCSNESNCNSDDCDSKSTTKCTGSNCSSTGESCEDENCSNNKSIPESTTSASSGKRSTTPVQPDKECEGPNCESSEQPDKTTSSNCESGDCSTSQTKDNCEGDECSSSDGSSTINSELSGQFKTSIPPPLATPESSKPKLCSSKDPNRKRKNERLQKVRELSTMKETSSHIIDEEFRDRSDKLKSQKPSNAWRTHNKSQSEMMKELSKISNIKDLNKIMALERQRNHENMHANSSIKQDSKILQQISKLQKLNGNYNSNVLENIIRKKKYMMKMKHQNNKDSKSYSMTKRQYSSKNNHKNHQSGKYVDYYEFSSTPKLYQSRQQGHSKSKPIMI